MEAIQTTCSRAITASRHLAEGSEIGGQHLHEATIAPAVRLTTALRSASLICSPTAPWPPPSARRQVAAPEASAWLASPQSPPAEPHWRQRLAPAPRTCLPVLGAKTAPCRATALMVAGSRLAR